MLHLLDGHWVNRSAGARADLLGARSAVDMHASNLVALVQRTRLTEVVEARSGDHERREIRRDEIRLLDE
jgi:hypothetical protein